MTKTQIAAELATLGVVLTASQIKKTSLADLQAQLDAAQKPKAERKPRALKPHTYCQPTDDAQKVVPVREGSKKHALFTALLDGATLEELQEATGWTRATVQSSFSYDAKNSGFGVERREDGRYYLLLPSGMTGLPVITEELDRAAALVAACRS